MLSSGNLFQSFAALTVVVPDSVLWSAVCDSALTLFQAGMIYTQYGGGPRLNR